MGNSEFCKDSRQELSCLESLQNSVLLLTCTAKIVMPNSSQSVHIIYKPVAASFNNNFIFSLLYPRSSMALRTGVWTAVTTSYTTRISSWEFKLTNQIINVVVFKRERKKKTLEARTAFRKLILFYHPKSIDNISLISRVRIFSVS